jgi:hypothetical protein
MKLEIWVVGSLEIMHVFFFCSYVENSENMANLTHKLDPVITQKVLKIFL